MLTNPNTLGLFDCNVQEVLHVVHEAGGFVRRQRRTSTRSSASPNPARSLRRHASQDLLHSPRWWRPRFRCGRVAAHLAVPLPGLSKRSLHWFHAVEKYRSGEVVLGQDFGGYWYPLSYIRMPHSPRATARSRQEHGAERQLFPARLRDTYPIPHRETEPAIDEFVAQGNWRVHPASSWRSPSG